MIKLLLLLAALSCASYTAVTYKDSALSTNVDSVKISKCTNQYGRPESTFTAYVTKIWRIKFTLKDAYVDYNDSAVFGPSSKPSLNRITKARYDSSLGIGIISKGGDTVLINFNIRARTVLKPTFQTFTCTATVNFKKTFVGFQSNESGRYIVFKEDSVRTYYETVFRFYQGATYKSHERDSFKIYAQKPKPSSTELNIAKKPTAFGKPIALFDVSGRRVEGVQRNGVYVEFDGRNYRKRTLLK